MGITVAANSNPGNTVCLVGKVNKPVSMVECFGAVSMVERVGAVCMLGRNCAVLLVDMYCILCSANKLYE